MAGLMSGTGTFSASGGVRNWRWLVPVLLLAGTALRLRLAWLTFLNPDEALHYFVSVRPTFRDVYEASLTTAHPPLMIVLLHSWAKLGASEFFLRLPFVAASIGFGWVLYSWMKRVATQSAACFALALSLFLPSLVALGAEIRQYSLLLLFCALCVYALERSLQESSTRWMILSGPALCLALLTHYSALIFAASAGVYGLMRMWQAQSPGKVRLAWVVGQLFALALCGFLFWTQVIPLRHSGVPSEIASTWLSSSIFHPGQEHVIGFAFSKTVRLFRYFFSHGTIGVAGLLGFILGLAALTSKKGAERTRAVLLILPFLITLTCALAAVYPYGGTRHDAVLALFAIAGLAIGLEWLELPLLRSCRAKGGLLGVALLACNFFPSPSGPHIRPRNQNRKLMAEAISFLRTQPPGSTVLTDYQGGLVVGYYLCHKRTDLPFGESSAEPFHWRCGEYNVLSSTRTQQGFETADLPDVLRDARNQAESGKPLWLFQTGWIDDKPERWAAALRDSGCTDLRNFGPNIRLCHIG